MVLLNNNDNGNNDNNTVCRLNLDRINIRMRIIIFFRFHDEAS